MSASHLAPEPEFEQAYKGKRIPRLAFPGPRDSI